MKEYTQIHGAVFASEPTQQFFRDLRITLFNDMCLGLLLIFQRE